MGACGAFWPDRAESFGGGDWIRTSVRRSEQIYSLPDLTTLPPLHKRLERDNDTAGASSGGLCWPDPIVSTAVRPLAQENHHAE